MSGFLDDMANSSHARVLEAQRRESFAALQKRAQAAPPAPPLKLSARGFDVIAELKLTSPAAGVLAPQDEDWRARVVAYARGGAVAVSVLTEPSRFDGSLEHLREAASLLAPLGVPAMRKDFLVDPYQVLEARAAGAGGILAIVRMLPRERLCALLDAAAESGLFVLLEAFDESDLQTAREVLAARGSGPGNLQDRILIGINSRDLQNLKVVKERFETLAPSLPKDFPAVAESGVATSLDALRMQHLGYRLALVGTALMTRDDPAVLLHEILAATRTVLA
ncbi:MAG TPA: indole-3-glycerol phosphate synthase TrpC [Steroidobacteraceae bacterium]